MTRLRDDERGMVIVTAVMLLLIMVAIALAVLSQVDTQTTQSRRERERESAFNLAEAALSAQTFVLGRRGTGTPVQPYPTDCSTAASTHFYCPASAQLMRSYSGANGSGQVDFDNATTWKTWVRDDANPSTGAPVLFWDDTYLANGSWARYDKGGAFDGTGASIPNRHVWVRAEATVRGKTRALVAYVRIEDKPVNFPQYAVLAGSVRGQEQRQQDARELDRKPTWPGRALQHPPLSANCIDLDPNKGPQLVPPGAYELNIPGNNANVPPDNPAIDSDALQSLSDRRSAREQLVPTTSRTQLRSLEGGQRHVGTEPENWVRRSTSATTSVSPSSISIAAKFAWGSKPRAMCRSSGKNSWRKERRPAGKTRCRG